MATIPDFWGEIAPAEVRTPAAILREQAAALGPKTRNLIEAQVVTHASQSGDIVHNFNLVVPALDDYTYQLFRIRHAAADLYPVTVADGVVLRNEDAFVAWLRERLSSDKTKRIIGNLLAQVNR